jgi:molecular chaperone DnaJ
MATPSADLYGILGVSPDASPAEISHAYRALVRRHHPDTRDMDSRPSSADVDATLREILAAYGVLRDPERRAAYDHGRATARHGATARQPTSGEASLHAGPVRWHTTPPAH